MKKMDNKTLTVLSKLPWIAFTYLLLMLAVAYLTPYLSPTPQSPFTICTAPFNSYWEGEGLNIWFTAFVLFFAETYMRLTDRSFDISVVVLSAVFVVYIINAMVLFLGGGASSGTSITGFTVLLFLDATILGDATHLPERLIRPHMSIPKAIGLILVYLTGAFMLIITLLPSLSGYLFNNPSTGLHILGSGVALFLAFSVLVLRKKHHDETENDKYLEKIEPASRY